MRIFIMRKKRSESLIQEPLARFFGFWKLAFRKLAFRKHGSSSGNLLQGEKSGQSLVLLAVAFFALLAFIGLVTDVGSIYVSHTQLQRAIDAAAIAAANNIKNPQASESLRKQRITEAAREMLTVHRITGVSDLEVYLCSDADRPAQFAAMCPATGQSPRKLAYIEATQDSPVYFLQIFGVRSFPLHVSAVGETAAVDLVLVFDTSMSMGKASFDPGDPAGRIFSPVGCNAVSYTDPLTSYTYNGNCQPLLDARKAAANLVDNLFDGYDQVAMVTFDFKAQLRSVLTSTFSSVHTAIQDNIHLHADGMGSKVKWTLASPWCAQFKINPIYLEDRDGDGQDADTPACVDEYVNQQLSCSPGDPPPANPSDNWGANVPDMWDDFTGLPCDYDTVLDAYDWDGDGIWRNPGGAADDPPEASSAAWNAPGGAVSEALWLKWEPTALISTCSGCGIRLATETLATQGRPGAVWVIVFLSDGVANLSDVHATYDEIPASFTYGFCGPTPPTNPNFFWSSRCVDRNTGFSAGRYCVDQTPNECPPTPPAALPPPFPNVIVGSTSNSGPYSVEDYAFDMVDRAGLLVSTNSQEPKGEDIVMFSVGLGEASFGETLLRYIANIGDEGSRGNDDCAGIPALQNCGNYYYAPTASYLSQIFENIAGRIFTKISR